MEKILVRTAAGTGVLQRILQNRAYAGTRLPEEIIELEQNLRAFIEYGQMTYGRIEDFLADLGYRKNQIRDMFKKITGIDPRHFYYERFNDYINTPPTIPGLNYAWGVSKNAKFDFYFVMPWVYGFCIFGQKGDLERSEVSFHYTLSDAKEALKKLVKETKDFYATINESILNTVDKQPVTQILASDSDEYNKAYLFLKQNKDLDKAKKIDFVDYLLINQKVSNDEYSKLVYAFIPEVIFENEKVEYTGEDKLEMGFNLCKGFAGQIKTVLGKNLYKVLWDEHDSWTIETGDKLRLISTNEILKNAREMDDKEKLLQEPLEKEIDERTPQQFFDQQLEKDVEVIAPAHMQRILDYLKEKNQHLTDYSFNVVSFKYIVWEGADKGEIDKHLLKDAPTPLISSAVAVCLLDVTELSSSKSKMGMSIFFIAEDDVTSTDLIKGEDNLSYGLTDLGLAEYFRK